MMEQNDSEKLWQSLEQYNNDPKFREIAEKEFMSSPLQEDGGMGRREFLKLMGASVAMASAACIRRPANQIVPYVKRPMEVIPGIANYYASSWNDSGQGFGLIMKTREGRPIKAEGLPDHPINDGGLSARAQALTLSLYDPDRLKGPKRNLQNQTRSNRDSVGVSWDEADKEVITHLKKGRVRLLTSTVASPSTKEIIDSFCRTFGAEHVQWDLLGAEDVREAQEISYGNPILPRYRFDKAKVIVSLGADFLGSYLSPVEFSKQYSAGRKAGPLMNRLVVFESLYSLTGGNADTRVAVSADQLLDVAMGLLNELVVVNKRSSYANNTDLQKILEGYQDVPARLGFDGKILAKLASDLWAARGESLIVAGGINTRSKNSVSLQVAVNLLNSILDNDGKTIDATTSPVLTYQGSTKAMSKLIKDMKAGRVGTLIVHGTNPAYTLPKSAAFMDAIKKVALVVYTGDRIDESGKLADLILPDHHALEGWGDFEFQKNVFSIQQPTIRPMYDTRAFQDSLLKWMGKEANYHEYLKAYWQKNIHSKWTSKPFDDFWVDVLQNGVVDLSNQSAKRNQTTSARNFNSGAIRNLQVEANKSDEMKLILYAKPGTLDGSMANVTWLQEFPDPVTKITWDNYLCVAPSYAEANKMVEGQIAYVGVGEQVIEVPIHIQPGQHPKTVGLAVGYGRTGAGAVGDGVGVNAMEVAEWKNDSLVTSNISVKLDKNVRVSPLASTQSHHSMEGRDILANTTLVDYMKNKSAGVHRHKLFSIWDEHKYPGHKWGMVIDYNSCTGCSACVVACQAENNIPAVGKKYVLKGREMHWIRIDRYYKGEPTSPESLFQPMLCQHCDNAPCETVCPVVATSHSSEGLNEMTYNRCVGTRYCSNNCPYKVRRFNWFNYVQKNETLAMAYNPEVTVRSRGVMEKCTFCVQRIKEVKQNVADRKDKLQDGEIKVACEQSCPADAIVFGDVNDPNSRVAKLYNSERASVVLEELNTKSAIRYLSKIRNPLIPKTTSSNEGGHHA